MAVAVLALLLCVLIVNAPARVLASLAGDSVKMSGISGSIWRGQARDLRVTTPWGEWRLGQTSWQLSRRSLLLLSLGIQLDTQWQGQQLSALLNFSPGGDVTVVSARVIVPAALAKVWFPVSLGGTFNGSLSDAKLQGQSLISGIGKLRWLDAGWTAAGSRISLGHYTADLSASQGVVDAVVSTVSGPVAVAGNVSWRLEDYALDLSLSSEQTLDQNLRNALSLVASQTDTGFRLRYPAP
ncbi:MAG: general secretion pathway protein N [Halieaceae bacterium]|jgi:general secretion pathway protein N